jgi:hypothetical protein
MFAQDQTIVLRGLHQDGRVASVECARVLRDDDEGLVTWVGRGSALVRRTTLAGEPVRYMPLSEKLSVPLMYQTGAWRGPGVVIYTPPDARHAVWWFYSELGEFESWYINLQSPARRWWGGVDIRDHALDVVVSADRSWRWKDEDEFAERTGHPLYWTDAEAAAIRAEGERLIQHAVAGTYVFDGRWCDFRPDPAWPPASLPWWWDQLPPGETGPSEPGPRPGILIH